jgi:hypothetical protein
MRKSLDTSLANFVSVSEDSRECREFSEKKCVEEKVTAPAAAIRQIFVRGKATFEETSNTQSKKSGRQLSTRDHCQPLYKIL